MNEHRAVLEELAEVWDECRNPNWEGYRTLPIKPDTLRNACELVASLPSGFPQPSISAEPDGHLTLEWYRSSTRNLSTSIGPDREIAYAGLFGDEEHYGTVPPGDAVPPRILRLASEV